MAKTSMVNREIKREKLAKRYGAKRIELKAVISSLTASYDEKMVAQAKLPKLPRPPGPTRQRRHHRDQAGHRAIYLF